MGISNYSAADRNNSDCLLRIHAKTRSGEQVVWAALIVYSFFH